MPLFDTRSASNKNLTYHTTVFDDVQHIFQIEPRTPQHTCAQHAMRRRPHPTVLNATGQRSAVIDLHRSTPSSSSFFFADRVLNRGGLVQQGRGAHFSEHGQQFWPSVGQDKRTNHRAGRPGRPNEQRKLHPRFPAPREDDGGETERDVGDVGVGRQQGLRFYPFVPTAELHTGP